jgi:hypothetical protein
MYVTPKKENEMEIYLSFFIAFAIYLLYVLSWANIVWFKQSLDEQTKRHEEIMKILD